MAANKPNKPAVKPAEKKEGASPKLGAYRINPSQPFTTGYIHKRVFYRGDSDVELSDELAAELKERGIIGEAKPETVANDEPQVEPEPAVETGGITPVEPQVTGSLI